MTFKGIFVRYYNVSWAYCPCVSHSSLLSPVSPVRQFDLYFHVMKYIHDLFIYIKIQESSMAKLSYLYEIGLIFFKCDCFHWPPWLCKSPNFILYGWKQSHCANILHVAQSLKTRAGNLSCRWKAMTPRGFQGQPDVLASILASAPKSYFASWLSQTLYLVPTSPSDFLPKARLFKKAGVNSPFCLRSSIPFLDSLSPPISCCVQSLPLGPCTQSI